MVRQSTIQSATVAIMSGLVAMVLVVGGCKRGDSPKAVGVLIIHSASEIPDPAGEQRSLSPEQIAKEQQENVATLGQRSFLSEALQDATAHQAISDTAWS